MLTNVYVDGFNLYYGCLKGTRHRWLDLGALIRRLLPDDEIHRIRYYTARVIPRPDDPDLRNRQEFYLRALATIPLLSLHFGRFETHTTRMRLANPPATGPRTVEVIKTEEKGTDVNLATHFVADAFRGDCQTSVVITNDADLAEPVRLVRHELHRTVGVVNPYPANRRSGGLAGARPSFFKQIRTSDLEACQFPDKINDERGEIRRPQRW